MDEAQPAGQRCGIVFHRWVCLGLYFSRFLVRRLGGSLVGRVRNAPQPRRKTSGLGKKLAHRRGGAVALAENGRETVAKVQQIRDKPNRNLIFRQLGAGGMRCGCMKKALGRNHRAWGMGGRAFPSYRSKFRMNQKYLF